MPRFLRFAFLAAAVAFAAPQGAFALQPEAAKTLVQATSDKATALVSGGDLAGQKEALSKLLSEAADMRQIAGFALGRYARQMPDGEKEAYVALFTEYVTRWFSDRFVGYKGETLSITGATDLGDKGVVVNSQIKIPDAAPIALDWSVSDKSGAAKISDLVIEGASLAQTHRSEFVSMIEARGGDLNAFLQDLRARLGK